MSKSKDVDGNTPLHLASMHNHCPVMLYLTRDKRSDLWLWNNDQLTALDVAMKSGSLSTKYSALLGRAILITAGVPQSKGRDTASSPTGLLPRRNQPLAARRLLADDQPATARAVRPPRLAPSSSFAADRLHQPLSPSPTPTTPRRNQPSHRPPSPRAAVTPNEPHHPSSFPTEPRPPRPTAAVKLRSPPPLAAAVPAAGTPPPAASSARNSPGRAGPANTAAVPRRSPSFAGRRVRTGTTADRPRRRRRSRALAVVSGVS
ncbi:hypothetical protein NL676_000867 [Syzygium grande]|nr:hypothetical protein NL676_000867 [Syzygium grande]